MQDYNSYLCRMMDHQPTLFDDRRIYSLFELTGNIREVLQEAYPDCYWIKAEIAKLNFYPKSGHCYVDLVDKQERNIRAQMRATIWASAYQMISDKFRDQTRENLRDGMTVLFLASVSFHEVYGLSLNIVDIEPSFTLGEMAREKRDTIEALKKEGIFDLNRKKSLPPVPNKIAVISVESSKGYHDFMVTIRNNPYGYSFRCSLFPSVLQGEKAVETVIDQLMNIARQHAHFDVVTIIRGGGGEVGLSAYDTLKLAREVAVFPLPVITGIGHSTNETVVEMVAHTNLITPTAVASFLIGQFKTFEDRIDSLRDELFRESGQILQDSLTRMANLSHRFHSATLRLLQQPYSELVSSSEKMSIFLRYILEKQSHTLETYQKKIELLDPMNTLKRGYSITLLDDVPLTDASLAGSGSEIKTVLYKGTLDSKVI